MSEGTSLFQIPDNSLGGGVKKFKSYMTSFSLYRVDSSNHTFYTLISVLFSVRLDDEN